jgi:hypothetical protein
MPGDTETTTAAELWRDPGHAIDMHVGGLTVSVIHPPDGSLTISTAVVVDAEEPEPRGEISDMETFFEIDDVEREAAELKRRADEAGAREEESDG